MVHALNGSVGICDFCLDTICHPQSRWGFHHQQPLDLQNSAEQRCIFCVTLLQDISTLSKGVDILKTAKGPLYRWNIGSTGQLRENNDLILVTFRAVVASGPPGLTNITDALPERTFHFHREQDFEFPPTDKDFGHSTDGPQAWAQVQEWIDTCRREHDACHKEQDHTDFLPARVLDCSGVSIDDPNAGRVIVVETEGKQLKGPYVTLSHCWGQQITRFGLTKSKYAEFTTNGFEWKDQDLPRNFKHAILAARHLKVRYLWIDSLCIVQAEPGDPGDFSHEARRMHEYYRHSRCNIAAADSTNPGEGLFRPRISTKGLSFSVVPPRLVPRPGNSIFGGHIWRVISTDLWEQQLLREPLYTRGWVFQERLLAPRLLHFSKNQIFWDCATTSACEGLPKGIPRLSDVTAAGDRYWRQQLHDGFSLLHRPVAGEADISIKEFWRSSVRRYTSCMLTNGNDKLIALWGFARLVIDGFGERMAAGMFEKDLEEQLAWRVDNCRQAGGKSSSRPFPLRAPSWSWISIDAIIDLAPQGVGRVYKVTDHQGGPIHFRIKDDMRHRSSLGGMLSPEMIQDSFNNWNQGVKKLESQRSTPVLKHNDSQSSLGMKKLSEGPQQLQTPAIEIKGYLRQCYLTRSDDVSLWSLAMFNPTSDAAGQRISAEIFLDQPLGGRFRQFWCVVLAYSEKNDDQMNGSSPPGTGLYDHDEYDEEEDESEHDGSVKDSEAHTATYGLGLSNTSPKDLSESDIEISDAPLMNRQQSSPPIQNDMDDPENGTQISPDDDSKMLEEPQQHRTDYFASPTRGVPSYSGVGLLLDRNYMMVDDDHFVRVGCFYFDNLAKTELDAITTSQEEGSKILGTHVVNTLGEQNFWLV